MRRDGVITHAAQVLYGTRFLPDYPQALLKMGRFRGTKITGDILDNRHEHLNAFAAVREAMAFLDRTLPLAAHFTEGEISRDDRLPVPPDALREIILNAVIHRDYSDPSGYVAIAVFDDRIETRSVGALPRGITPELLSQPHRSIHRNPLMAAAFHLTGAIETWGRGTNRVIEECGRYGVQPPTFEEQLAALVVTFWAAIAHDITKRPSEADLTPRQAEILQVITSNTPIALRDINARLSTALPSTTLRDELYRLKRLKLIDATGRGRGAVWSPKE